MKTTNVQSYKDTEVEASYEISKFALGVGITLAALVGIWGCACMISGLLNNGLGEIMKGLLTAITGN